jgi:PE family
MSFVTATPELVQGATQDVAGTGSSLAQAGSAAAGPTTRVVTAAQDEVLLALASLSGHEGLCCGTRVSRRSWPVTDPVPRQHC